MRDFVRYLQTSSEADYEERSDFYSFIPYEYKGYAILIVLLMSKWPLAIWTEVRAFNFTSFSSRLSTAQNVLVYKKSLRLSAATNKSVSSGEIINIYSNDCRCHLEVFTHISSLTRFIMQIIVYSLLLYKIVGASFLCVFATTATGLHFGNMMRKCKSKN
jgi:hypothetical protein